MHGKGKLVYTNNEIYEGEWVAGDGTARELIFMSTVGNILVTLETIRLMGRVKQFIVMATGMLATGIMGSSMARVLSSQTETSTTASGAMAKCTGSVLTHTRPATSTQVSGTTTKEKAAER